MLVTGNERNQERADSHQNQRRNQCRLPPQTVAVVAEYCGANWPGDKTHRINPERLHRADQRISPGEIHLCKHEAGDGAVQEEVVPLDRRSDRARQHRAAKLTAMLGFIHDGLLAGGHWASLSEDALKRSQAVSAFLDFAFNRLSYCG